MEIKDLQPKQGNVDIVAEVVEKGDVREFQKFGKAGRVCNAKLKDDSGEIALTLWNDDIEKVSVGDRIHIKNGYVNEWQGEPQLTTGKFGTIEVLEKDSVEEKSVKKKAEPKKAKAGKAKKEPEPEDDEDFDDDDDDFEEEVVD